jgi:hypothetical protein
MDLSYVSYDDTNIIKEIPKLIYKYRNYADENHRKIIEKQEIYLSQPSKFNCPYELNVSIDKDYIKDELNRRKYYQNYLNLNSLHHPEIDKHISEVTLNDESIRNHEKLLKAEYDKMFGVFSASRTYKNERLWKDFGGNKKGFCVGIDFLKAIPINEGFKGLINYVEKDKLPKNKILDIEGIDEFIKSFINWFFALPLQYIEEQEYRFAKLITTESERIRQIPKESIYEIILGESISKSKEKEIIQMIETNLPNTKIKKLRYCKYGVKEILLK